MTEASAVNPPADTTAAESTAAAVAPKDERGRMRRFFFPLLPAARLAVLARVMYGFVILDVLWLHHTGEFHGYIDPMWYEPLIIGKLLHIPAASVVPMQIVKWSCVVAAGLGMLGKFPRLSAWTVFFTWVLFQYWAFAYGKVDHDRADFVVGLLLVAMAGRLSVNDRRPSELHGFVIRGIQLGAIATYFLSVMAKGRFTAEFRIPGYLESEWYEKPAYYVQGAWTWMNSATMARAVVRRGTEMGHWFMDIPQFLHLLQISLVTLEFLSPIIFFVAVKWQYRITFGWYFFHVMVFQTITIFFYPHLIMMLAFLPLEDYYAWVKAKIVALFRRFRGRAAVDPPPTEAVA